MPKRWGCNAQVVGMYCNAQVVGMWGNVMLKWWGCGARLYMGCPSGGDMMVGILWGCCAQVLGILWGCCAKVLAWCGQSSWHESVLSHSAFRTGSGQKDDHRPQKNTSGKYLRIKGPKLLVFFYLFSPPQT